MTPIASPVAKPEASSNTDVSHNAENHPQEARARTFLAETGDVKDLLPAGKAAVTLCLRF